MMVTTYTIQNSIIDIFIAEITPDLRYYLTSLYGRKVDITESRKLKIRKQDNMLSFPGICQLILKLIGWQTHEHDIIMPIFPFKISKLRKVIK